MTKIKEAIYEHIQLKDITNQQATIEHVQQSSSASGVVIHSLLTKGNTATQTQPIQCCKGPFLCFCFLHAPLMYRHESNDFFLFVLMFLYALFRWISILMPQQRLFGFLTFSIATPFDT